VRLDEKIREQRVDLLRRVVDLVIPLRAAGQLQPVQRAFTGQRSFGLALAAHQGHQRIVPQLLVVVEVFIAQRQTVDALRQHLAQTVLDPVLPPPVGETGRHTLQQTDLAVHLAQQQRAAVARHLPRGEARLHTARKMRCKLEDFLVTLCHGKGPFSSAIIAL